MLAIRLQVIVPLPTWDLTTKQPLTNDMDKYTVETELIYKYSPFKTQQQLMEQFSKIEGSSGEYRFTRGCVVDTSHRVVRKRRLNSQRRTPR